MYLRLGLSSEVGDPHRPYIIHPTTLDSMFHAAFAAFQHPKGQSSSATVPKSIHEVQLLASAPEPSFKASLMPSRKGVRRVDLRFWSYEILISSGQQSRSKAFCCAALSAHTESLRDETHPSREERFYSECVWRPVRFRKQHASTTGLFKDTQSVHDPTDNESPDRSGLPLGHEGSSLGLNEITTVETRYPSGSRQLLCAKLVHDLMSNRIMSV